MRCQGPSTFVHLNWLVGTGKVAMDENDRHLTAFVTHEGLYQFKVMLFGLTNSPATF